MAFCGHDHHVSALEKSHGAEPVAQLGPSFMMTMRDLIWCEDQAVPCSSCSVCTAHHVVSGVILRAIATYWQACKPAADQSCWVADPTRGRMLPCPPLPSLWPHFGSRKSVRLLAPCATQKPCHPLGPSDWNQFGVISYGPLGWTCIPCCKGFAVWALVL